MLALVWFLTEVSLWQAGKRTKWEVDALRSDLVKKTDQEAETWVLQERHVSVTQSQPAVEGLLFLSDFPLNHADNKELPTKQLHKPELIDFRDEQ